MSCEELQQVWAAARNCNNLAPKNAQQLLEELYLLNCASPTRSLIALNADSSSLSAVVMRGLGYPGEQQTNTIPKAHENHRKPKVVRLCNANKQAIPPEILLYQGHCTLAMRFNPIVVL
eukprot:1498635-Amphidinium_carterae.1